jgi:hypothetical protein
MDIDSIFRDPSPPAGPAGPAGADGAPGPAGPAGPAGDPADLPQPLGVLDSPQFESLGVGTDPNLPQGIALDVAGGAIRVSNPEGDEVTKRWSLLTRPYDTDKLDCALFTADSRAGSGVDSGVDLYIGGKSLSSTLPLNNIYFGTSSAYGTGAMPTRMMIDYLGNVVCGGASASPGGTTNFLYISGGDVAPSRAPAKAYVGRRPLYYDYAASRLYVYNDGAWRAVGTGTETVLPSVCDARLTLTQGVPVTTSDVIGASTVYLTRYRGAHVALWDGSQWVLHEVPSGDVSLALSGLTAGKNYDVFVYDDEGTLTLVLGSAWTNDTTRADALAYQDGVRVLASDHTRRLVGTIRATAATTTEDSVTKRFKLNEAHRVPRLMCCWKDASWTYNSPNYRTCNNDAAYIIEFLAHPDDVQSLYAMWATVGGGTHRKLSLSVDGADSDPLWPKIFPCTITGSLDDTFVVTCSGDIPLAAGYHYCNPVEKAPASQSYTGAGAGLRGVIWA